MSEPAHERTLEAAAVELEFLDRRVREQLTAAAKQGGPDFDVVPLSITLLLHRVTSMLVKASTLDLEPLGFTATQFNVLTVLHRAGRPMNMSRLADTVSIRPPNLTTVVDSLRASGLVAKTVSREDRRSYRVSMTAEGTELMGGFLPGHWRFMHTFYAGLAADERLTLARLLDRLLVSVHAGDDAAAEIAPRIVAAAEDN